MKKLNEKDAKQASGGVGDRIEDLVLTGHVGKDDVKEGQMNDLSNDLKDDWVPEKIVQDKTFFYVFFMCFAICFIRTFMSMSIQAFEPCQTLVIGMLMYVNSSNYTERVLE